MCAVLTPRQVDGVFHTLATSRASADVSAVLIGRQHVLEQRSELHLTKGAPIPHVAQHAPEIADAFGQGLHLTETSVELLEAVANLLKRLAKPVLEHSVQLVVHG